ncbi:MAG: c-type cytochrome [Gammaproteobacteria bacterium]|nr:c-type cytochrome [Gammaproteobacteria bacterium]
MKVVKIFLCFLSSIVFFTTAAAQEMGYAICVTCHGADGAGNIALNSPAIAGQESWYVETQLKNFKAGIRGAHKADIYGMQMRPMALTLADDAAVTRVSGYVSSMKPARITNTVEGNLDTGKALYAVCAACHGQDAKGLKAMNSPNLTLQQDWYMVRQLQNFKAGLRGSDPKDVFGQQMRPMAMILANDQAINDVVAYINSLR